MEYITTTLSNLLQQTAFLNLTFGNIVMIFVALIFLYLVIGKGFEPLLLLPISFGMLLVNIYPDIMRSIEDSSNGVGGLLHYFYLLDEWSILPSLIFMGVGALTDFGPMLRNLRLSIFGAAAQLGIFTVLLVAILMGFTPKEAASLGIIGGADGPTAIFTTIKLAPHLLGPIAIAAYSYMALVPVIIPLVVKLLCSKKELRINMKEQEKKYPSNMEIKNLRVLKIIFPIVVTTVVALFVPSSVPLIGMLMFGNLVKEIGRASCRERV